MQTQEQRRHTRHHRRGRGHFWEKRYYAEGFLPDNHQRALNTLRYIDANLKAARMRTGFFYDFSNYGSYDRLTDDGLTQWHPAFLHLGETVEACVAAYQRFCKRYQPQAKPPRTYHWGSRLLAGLRAASTRGGIWPITHPSSPRGDDSPPSTLDGCQVSDTRPVMDVVERFIAANRPPQAAEMGV